MKKLLFCVISMVMCLFVSCDSFFSADSIYDICVWNHSNHDILTNSFKCEKDTLLPSRYYTYGNVFNFETDSLMEEEYVDPVEEISCHDCGNGEISLVFLSYVSPNKDWFEMFPDKTLHVYIFHGDTIRTHTWEEIRDSYNILVRYDLTYEDIKKFKGPCPRIPFPPTDVMKDMKMYPPYEEVIEKYR